MAVDYDKFTPEERDTFVKNVLTEEEIKTATFLMIKSSHGQASSQEILEVCFQAARRKMEEKIVSIRLAREHESKD